MFLLYVFAALFATAAADSLPTIDLGYALQQPTSYNSQYDLYIFYDIRYAAAPTGANRFRAPLVPSTNRSQVQTGGTQWVCPQGIPRWQSITGQFFPQYVNGQTNFTEGEFQSTEPPTTPQAAREVEDCLFLDVYAPKTVLDEEKSVPVVVQIYGGGFIAGAKDINPGGWFDTDREQEGERIVFVSINYRLGAFGWLAGSQDVDANVGLLDQQFAFRWVREHIAKFGGDPDNVTVIGESAGAGSIMHHITAFGGASDSPDFQRGIIQSPGFRPIDEDSVSEATSQEFLDLLNVSTIDEARALPFEDLYIANAKQIANAPYGQFVYGPVVDGTFVPDLPGKSLLSGQFHKNVSLIVGHNTDEGILFTNPYIHNDTAFLSAISSWIPSPSNLAFINSTLYPPIFNGTYPYTSQLARTAFALSELVFVCNTYYLEKAFGDEIFSYLFAVPPGNHGLDVGFTYYAGGDNGNPQVQVAECMQREFLGFVKSGMEGEEWPQYGDEGISVVFNVTGNGRLIREEEGRKERCAWWQENL